MLRGESVLLPLRLHTQTTPHRSDTPAPTSRLRTSAPSLIRTTCISATSARMTLLLLASVWDSIPVSPCDQSVSCPWKFRGYRLSGEPTWRGDPVSLSYRPAEVGVDALRKKGLCLCSTPKEVLYPLDERTCLHEPCRQCGILTELPLSRRR